LSILSEVWLLNFLRLSNVNHDTFQSMSTDLDPLAHPCVCCLSFCNLNFQGPRHGLTRGIAVVLCGWIPQIKKPLCSSRFWWKKVAHKADTLWLWLTVRHGFSMALIEIDGLPIKGMVDLSMAM
jgi:hypothetical protein